MAPRPGLTPDRIVDTAAQVADRDGLDAVTLATVAAELGVRPPSLYNHVDGLDGLRRRLTVRAVEQLNEEMQQAAVGRTGGDAVAAIAAAYRRFGHEHPGLYAATVPSAEGEDEAIASAGRRAVATVVGALRGFGLCEEEAIHATRAIRAAAHGFTSLELAGGFGLDVDVDASFARLIGWLVDGMEAAAAPGPES